jgi:hypothetical membrane protein
MAVKRIIIALCWPYISWRKKYSDTISILILRKNDMMNFFAIKIYLSGLLVAPLSNLFRVLLDNDEKGWLFIVTVILIATIGIYPNNKQE